MTATANPPGGLASCEAFSIRVNGVKRLPRRESVWQVDLDDGGLRPGLARVPRVLLRADQQRAEIRLARVAGREHCPLGRLGLRGQQRGQPDDVVQSLPVAPGRGRGWSWRFVCHWRLARQCLYRGRGRPGSRSARLSPAWVVAAPLIGGEAGQAGLSFDDHRGGEQAGGLSKLARMAATAMRLGMFRGRAALSSWLRTLLAGGARSSMAASRRAQPASTARPEPRHEFARALRTTVSHLPPSGGEAMPHAWGWKSLAARLALKFTST